MFLGIDYATWWFLVVGGLFSGYAILDGFDLGAGALHLFLDKEESRRIALNAVGPVWDGNEVWLVIGGGALFAGFPPVYAGLFSIMYIPFMLFLGFLIFRAVSIEFRSKEPMAWWRRMWDTTYCISSGMLGFLLGVVLGNVLQGIAIGPDYAFEGSWLDFLTPYPILVGITSLALFMMHGALYLSMKTEGRLFAKIVLILRRLTTFFIATFVLTTAYTLLFIPHLSDSLLDSWWIALVPAAIFAAIIAIPVQVRKHRYLPAFLLSASVLAMLLMLVAIELYPVIIRSTVAPEYSMTVFNSSASEKSLGIVLTMAAIGTPLVLSYTAFVFWTFRGKVTLDEMSY